MLAWRVAISAILIPTLVGIFYLDAHAGESALYLLALCIVVALRSVWELTRLLRDHAQGMHNPTIAVCVVLLLVAGWLPHFGPNPAPAINLTPLGYAYALVVMLLCTLALFRFNGGGGHVQTLAQELFVVTYIGSLFALTTQLRWVGGGDGGYLALGSVMICAKVGDIGAFFTGRMCGRRKLAPLLSPGKTVEGLIGGLLAAGIAGWAWLTFATPLFIQNAQPCAWYFAVLYGVLVGLAGAIGDLVESLIKRDVGQKDSAALFPGFGGLLDMLDSVLFAGPIAVLLWEWLPLATWLKR